MNIDRSPGPAIQDDNRISSNDASSSATSAHSLSLTHAQRLPVVSVNATYSQFLNIMPGVKLAGHFIHLNQTSATRLLKSDPQPQVGQTVEIRNVPGTNQAAMHGVVPGYGNSFEYDLDTHKFATQTLRTQSFDDFIEQYAKSIEKERPVLPAADDQQQTAMPPRSATVIALQERARETPVSAKASTLSAQAAPELRAIPSTHNDSVVAIAGTFTLILDCMPIVKFGDGQTIHLTQDSAHTLLTGGPRPAKNQPVAILSYPENNTAMMLWESDSTETGTRPRTYELDTSKYLSSASTPMKRFHDAVLPFWEPKQVENG